MSMHKKDTQLMVKPQSSARYLTEKNSLLASRFITIMLTINSDNTLPGILLINTL